MLLSKVAKETFLAGIREREQIGDRYKQESLERMQAGELPSASHVGVGARNLSQSQSLNNVLKFIEAKRISGISTNNVKKMISEVGDVSVYVPKRGAVSSRSPVYLISTAWYTKRVYLNTLIPEDYKHINLSSSAKSLGATKPDTMVRARVKLDKRTLRWLRLTGKATRNMPVVNVSFGIVPRFADLGEKAKERYENTISRVVSASYMSENLSHIPGDLADDKNFAEVAQQVFNTMAEIVVKALNAKATTTNTWYSFGSFVNQYVSDECTRITNELVESKRRAFNYTLSQEERERQLDIHMTASLKYGLVMGLTHLMGILSSTESLTSMEKSLDKIFPLMRAILNSGKSEKDKQADMDALINDFKKDNLVIAFISQDMVWDAIIDISTLNGTITGGNNQVSMACKMNDVRVFETYAKAMDAEDLYKDVLDSVRLRGTIGKQDKLVMFKSIAGMDPHKLYDGDTTEGKALKNHITDSDFTNSDYASYFPLTIISPKFVQKQLEATYNLTRSMVRLSVDYMLATQFPPITKSANNG